MQTGFSRSRKEWFQISSGHEDLGKILFYVEHFGHSLADEVKVFHCQGVNLDFRLIEKDPNCISLALIRKDPDRILGLAMTHSDGWISNGGWKQEMDRMKTNRWRKRDEQMNVWAANVRRHILFLLWHPFVPSLISSVSSLITATFISLFTSDTKHSHALLSSLFITALKHSLVYSVIDFQFIDFRQRLSTSINSCFQSISIAISSRCIFQSSLSFSSIFALLQLRASLWKLVSEQSPVSMGEWFDPTDWIEWSSGEPHHLSEHRCQASPLSHRSYHTPFGISRQLCRRDL